MLNPRSPSIDFTKIAQMSESEWIACVSKSLAGEMAKCFKESLEKEKDNLNKELSGLQDSDKVINQKRITEIDELLSGTQVLEYSEEIVSLKQDMERHRQLFESTRESRTSDDLLKLKEMEDGIALKIRNQINNTFGVDKKFQNLAQDYPSFVRAFYAIGPKIEEGIIVKSRDSMREEYIQSYIEKNFPNLSPAEKELYINNLTFGTYTENFLQYVYKPQNQNGNDFSLFEKYLPYLCQNKFFSSKEDAMTSFAKLHTDIGNCAIGMNERLSNAIDNAKNPIKNIRQVYLFLLSKHTLPLKYPGHEVHRTGSLDYFLGIASNAPYLTEFIADSPIPILERLYLKKDSKNFLHDLYFDSLKDYYKDFFKNPSMEGVNDARFFDTKESIKNLYSIAAKISNSGFNVGDWAKLCSEPEISQNIIYNDDFDDIRPRSEIEDLINKYGGIEEVSSIAATQFLNAMEENAVKDPVFSGLVIDAQTKKSLQQVNALKFLSTRGEFFTPKLTYLTTEQFLSDFGDVFDYTENRGSDPLFDNYKSIKLKDGVTGLDDVEQSNIRTMLNDLRLVENTNGKFLLNDKLITLLMLENISPATLTREDINRIFSQQGDYTFNNNFDDFEKSHSIVFHFNHNDWAKTRIEGDVANNNKIQIKSFYDLHYFLNNPLSPWNMQSDIPFGSAEWEVPRSKIDFEIDMDLPSARNYDKIYIEANIMKDQIFELAKSRPHIMDQIEIVKKFYGSNNVFLEFVGRVTQNPISPSELMHIAGNGKTTFQNIFEISNEKGRELLSKIPNEQITLDLLTGEFGNILEKHDNVRYHLLIESTPNDQFTLDILKSDWWNNVGKKHADKTSTIYSSLKNRLNVMGINDLDSDFGSSVFHHEREMFVDLVSKIPDSEIKFKNLIGKIGQAIDQYDKDYFDNRFERIVSVAKVRTEYLPDFEEAYKAFLAMPENDSSMFDTKIVSLLSSRYPDHVYEILEKHKDRPNAGKRNDYLTRTWVDFWPNLASNNAERFFNFFQNYPNYYINCFSNSGGDIILSKGTIKDINTFLDRAIKTKHSSHFFFSALEKFNIVEKSTKKFLDIVINTEVNLGKGVLKHNANALNISLKKLTGLEIKVNDDSKFEVFSADNKITEVFDVEKLSETLTRVNFFENFPPSKFGASVFSGEMGLSFIDGLNEDAKKIYMDKIGELNSDQLKILLHDKVVVPKLIDFDFKRFLGYLPKDSKNQPILTSEQRTLMGEHLTKKLNQNIAITENNLVVFKDTNPDIKKAKSYDLNSFERKMNSGVLANPCKVDAPLRSKRSVGGGGLCIKATDVIKKTPEEVDILNEKLKKGGVMPSNLPENTLVKPNKIEASLDKASMAFMGFSVLKEVRKGNWEGVGLMVGGMAFSVLVEGGTNRLYLKVAKKVASNAAKKVASNASKIGAKAVKVIPGVGAFVGSTLTVISLANNIKMASNGDEDALIDAIFDATSLAVDVGIATLMLASSSTMGPAGIAFGLLLALGQETYHAASRASKLGNKINLSTPEHIAAFVRYFFGANESDANSERLAIKKATSEYINTALEKLKTFLEESGFTTVILPEGKTIVENFYESTTTYSCGGVSCLKTETQVLKDQKVSKEPSENAQTDVVIGDVSPHQGYSYFKVRGRLTAPHWERRIKCAIDPKGKPGDDYLNTVDDIPEGYTPECIPSMAESRREITQILPEPTLEGSSKKSYHQKWGRGDGEYNLDSSKCHNAYILNKQLFKPKDVVFNSDVGNPKHCFTGYDADKSGSVFAYLYNNENKIRIEGEQSNNRNLYTLIQGSESAGKVTLMDIKGPSNASTSGVFLGFIAGTFEAAKGKANSIDLRDFMKNSPHFQFEFKDDCLQLFQPKNEPNIPIAEWKNPSEIYLREGKKDDFYYANQKSDPILIRIDTLGGEKSLELQNTIEGDGGNINMIVDLYGGENVLINKFTPIINIKNDFNNKKPININYQNSKKRIQIKVDPDFLVESVKLFFSKKDDINQFVLQAKNGREVRVSSHYININFEFEGGFIMIPSAPQAIVENISELQEVDNVLLYANPTTDESFEAFKQRIGEVGSSNINYLKYANYNQAELVFGTKYNEIFRSLNPDSETVYFIDAGGENAFKIPADGRKTIIEIKNNEVKNIISLEYLNEQYGKIKVESTLKPNIKKPEFYDTILTFKTSDGRLLKEKLIIEGSAQIENGVSKVLLTNLQIYYNDKQIGYLRLMEGGSSPNMPNFNKIDAISPSEVKLQTLYDFDVKSYVVELINDDANALIPIYCDHDILDKKVSHLKFLSFNEEPLNFTKDGNDLIVIGNNQKGEKMYYDFKDFNKIIEHSNSDPHYQLYFTSGGKTYSLSEVKNIFQNSSFAENLINAFNDKVTHFEVKKYANNFNDVLRFYTQGKFAVIDLEGYNLVSSVMLGGLSQDDEHFSFNETLVFAVEDLETTNTQLIHIPGFNKKINSNILVVFNDGNTADLNKFYKESRADTSINAKTARLKTYLNSFESTTTKKLISRYKECQPQRPTPTQIYKVKDLAKTEWTGVHIRHNYCGENIYGVVDIAGYDIYTSKVMDASQEDKEFYEDKEDIHLVLIDKETNESQLLIIHGLSSDSEKNKNQYKLDIRLDNSRRIFLPSFKAEADEMNLQYEKTTRFNQIVEYTKLPESDLSAEQILVDNHSNYATRPPARNRRDAGEAPPQRFLHEKPIVSDERDNYLRSSPVSGASANRNGFIPTLSKVVYDGFSSLLSSKPEERNLNEAKSELLEAKASPEESKPNEFSRQKTLTPKLPEISKNQIGEAKKYTRYDINQNSVSGEIYLRHDGINGEGSFTRSFKPNENHTSDVSGDVRMENRKLYFDPRSMIAEEKWHDNEFNIDLQRTEEVHFESNRLPKFQGSQLPEGECINADISTSKTSILNPERFLDYQNNGIANIRSVQGNNGKTRIGEVAPVSANLQFNNEVLGSFVNRSTIEVVNQTFKSQVLSTGANTLLNGTAGLLYTPVKEIAIQTALKCGASQKLSEALGEALAIALPSVGVMALNPALGTLDVLKSQLVSGVASIIVSNVVDKLKETFPNHFEEFGKFGEAIDSGAIFLGEDEEYDPENDDFDERYEKEMRNLGRNVIRGIAGCGAQACEGFVNLTSNTISATYHAPSQISKFFKGLSEVRENSPKAVEPLSNLNQEERGCNNHI